eukprot:3078755-Pyramimonas_sp.AAC.1
MENPTPECSMLSSFGVESAGGSNRRAMTAARHGPTMSARGCAPPCPFAYVTSCSLASASCISMCP